MSDRESTIAILGGTGALGSGLARRFAGIGRNVVIGSRDAERASGVAAGIAQRGRVTAASLEEAAGAAEEIVFLCVPFAHQRTTLERVRAPLAGKILVDATVPLVPPKVMRVQLPAEGAAALRAQETVGADTTVVSALQNVGAGHLAKSADIDCDVLVTGDDKAARQAVIELLEAIGLRALHAGPLANAAAAEALTSMLIFINKHYGSDGAGIRITGI